MATGNRALIMVLAVVMLAAIAAAFSLDWSGKTGASAYIGLAAGALGIICPSPFRPASRPTAPLGTDGDASGGDASALGGLNNGV